MLALSNVWFFIALAVIAWIVICYWKFKESQRFRGTTVQTAAKDKMHVNGMTEFSCKDNFTFLLHFVYVCACMFGLVRLAKTAETFAISLKYKQLNNKERIKLNDLEQRIKTLEQENMEFHQRLCDRRIGSNTDLLASQQNIFISNRFFHMNNGHNGYAFNEGDAFRKVWQKYFQMQKQTPQLMATTAPDDKFMPNKLPFTKIVSTEELQAMHGFQ